MWNRWLAAINAPFDRALLAEAVLDTIVIERHGPAREESPRLETISGIDAVAAWLAKTAKRSVFSVKDRDGDEVEYVITVDEFRNGGRWSATAAPDGRIARLVHRPFPLP